MVYRKYYLFYVPVISILLTACGNNVRKEKTTWRVDTMLPTDSHSLVKVVEDSTSRNSPPLPALTPMGVTMYIQTILDYKDSTDKYLKSTKKITTIIKGSAEMGEAIAYIAATDTVKLHVVFYGELGKSVYEFYLKDGKVVYYTAKDMLYNRPIFESHKVKVIKTTYEQFIFLEETVVRWWHNNKLMEEKPADDPQGEDPFSLYDFVQEQIQEENEQ
ncbi:hypothetical protein [Chitinophaga sp. Cy-1792]|uniref:hypothetical protein n=1 Tax=Chitinophaga sp. Cy-1792 TaxID=2608339 RepID=UPI00141FFD73|nr:hypothetical protein [Chitinophaga sp. Cy-1792]NIG53538.1 hypothetical protein [Chitinophaga sp. Cy-1792]